MICDASVDAKRTLRRVDQYSQRVDHPVIATIPETAYLKGFCFQTIGEGSREVATPFPASS